MLTNSDIVSILKTRQYNCFDKRPFLCFINLFENLSSHLCCCDFYNKAIIQKFRNRLKKTKFESFYWHVTHDTCHTCTWLEHLTCESYFVSSSACFRPFSYLCQISTHWQIQNLPYAIFYNSLLNYPRPRISYVCAVAEICYIRHHIFHLCVCPTVCLSPVLILPPLNSKTV